MLIVVLNATLGVVQESKAEASLAALKKMAAPESQVLRDGIRLSIPARELVPGDIVYVEAGNYVPADIRLLESVNLRVEEATLTGESVPVQKSAALVLSENAALGDRKNMLFAATLVSYGRGHGVVVATGMETQIGMIADMLQSVDDGKTPLQNKLDKLGKTLAIAALLVCGLVFLLGLARSRVFTQGFTEASTAAVVAIVSASDFSERSRAIRNAVVGTNSSGTTRLTSPASSASQAEIGSPNKHISMARALPAEREIRWVAPPPGIMPSRISA